MNTDLIIVGLEGLAILAIWQFGWKRCSLDALRQTLFNIRDELFIDAARRQSGLALDDASYRLARQQLNGLIRYSHRISFPLILAAGLAGRRDPGPKSPLQVIVCSLPEGPKRTRIEQVQRDIAVATVKFVLATSPTMLLLAFAVGIVQMVRKGVGSVRQALASIGIAQIRSALNVIEIQAASDASLSKTVPA